MTTIISALSTLSFLTMGIMISHYHDWYLIIPLMGIAVFHGLNMAEAGKRKYIQEISSQQKDNPQ